MPKDRVPISPVARAGRALPGEEGGNRGMTPHGCGRSWRWLHVEYSDPAASILNLGFPERQRELCVATV